MISIRFFRVSCSLVLFSALCSADLQAQKLTTLHAFSGDDGAGPFAGLVQGSDGNFYGTTEFGGTPNQGTVFQITPLGVLKTLYSFSGGADGAQPTGELVRATDGNFYGTTEAGGAGQGTVFKVTSAGTLTTLHSFNGDGSTPVGGLVQASDGYLYGTTFVGGTQNSGTVFQASLDGMTFKTLYNFCPQTGCADGSKPYASLVQASDGNLYGTTAAGGTGNACNNGCGTVFKITPAGVLTTLYSFNKTDGSAPRGALIQADDGNFYGATYFGGSHQSGTVFTITPSGTLTTLYNFCTQNNCTDGSRPSSALVQGNDGLFYGTATSSDTGNGTIFSITRAGVYTLRHSFNSADGSAPFGSLVQGTDGNFYGTTERAGAGGAGTVFSFSTGGLQFVAVTPCRVVDTRNPNGTFGGPFISGNSSRDFPISQGSCNIPSTALAYSLNATIVPHGPLGYITVWPTASPRPLVSTMNSYDGRVKANALVISGGTNGGVSVYASDATDVVLDIDGYFQAPGNALAFYPVPPCRVADTRDPSGPLGGPFISGNSSRDFPVQSSGCGLPIGALAYSMNFTAVPHGPLGYLTVWPSDQQQPLVSTLNAYSGQTTANAAIVPAAQNGDISAYVSNDSDLIIDVNGYFAPAAMNGLSLYPLTPCRALDTRYGSGAFSGELTINVKGNSCPVPTSAQGYIFNATVLPKTVLGYLSLWADLQQQPGVSTLNSWDGAVTSNMAIVPTTNGFIDAFASDPTDLLLDITSYFAP